MSKAGGKTQRRKWRTKEDKTRAEARPKSVFTAERKPKFTDNPTPPNQQEENDLMSCRMMGHRKVSKEAQVVLLLPEWATFERSLAS